MANDQRKVVYITKRQNAKDKLLEQVMQQHGEALRTFLYMRLVPEPDHDDIIQELFVKLLRADNLEEKFAEQSGSTRCYLISIATSLLVDRYRYAARRQEDMHDSFEDDKMLSPHPSPESIAATEEEMNRAMALLKKMNPRHRRAFMLNRFRFKSYRRIAVEMGVGETTVERYIAAALAALRKGMTR